MRFFRILSVTSCASLILKGVCTRALLIIFLVAGLQVSAQTFPLKTNESNLLTKRGIPFLVNGRSADIYTNFLPEFYNLQRYIYLGLNTALVTLPQNISLTNKGKPQKALRKQLRNLKKFVREAALYNVAVFISTNTDSALSEDMRNKYLNYVFRTMNRARNVSWIISYQDSQSEAISLLNKNQLKAIRINNVGNTAFPDFQIATNVPGRPATTKPFVLLVEAGNGGENSDTVRPKIYTALLNGASGVITNYTNPAKTSLYNPLSQQLRLFKTTLDSLPWHRFRKFPEIINFDDTLQTSMEAVITADSTLAAVYIKQPLTRPLNLGTFKTKLKLSWINPVTGKSFVTAIVPVPEVQLFMPPYDEGKTNDWLLLITTFPGKNQ